MRASISTFFNNSSSLIISARILSGCICFLCTGYLALSIFYSSSLQHIVSSRLRFQPWKINIIKTENISKIIPTIEDESIIIIDNLSNESFICDHVNKTDVHTTTNISSFEIHRLNVLRPYCDIVPTPRNKWIPASRYRESDIVFLIYTGASFYHGRATAIRDTWLSRVTHKYFFSSTPYSSLPVTVIEGAGENYASNMKKTYIGMKIAYEKHNQTGKFYFLAGCDTFVNVPHLLKRLNSFDYRKPLIIGGHPFGHKCFIKKMETPYDIGYPSGGAGFFLSARMMEMMYPKLVPFFENDWPIDARPFSDVAINCLAYTMQVQPKIIPGFWAFTPEQTLKDHGKAKFHVDSEPNTFHYVQPISMYVLDEFYVFQYIDRLANDGNLNELVKFTRKFVAVHYELLRIKQNECTLPLVKLKK